MAAGVVDMSNGHAPLVEFHGSNQGYQNFRLPKGGSNANRKVGGLAGAHSPPVDASGVKSNGALSSRPFLSGGNQ